LVFEAEHEEQRAGIEAHLEALKDDGVDYEAQEVHT
jgi:biotin operon repressor